MIYCIYYTEKSQNNIIFPDIFQQLVWHHKEESLAELGETLHIFIFISNDFFITCRLHGFSKHFTEAGYWQKPEHYHKRKVFISVSEI